MSLLADPQIDEAGVGDDDFKWKYLAELHWPGTNRPETMLMFDAANGLDAWEVAKRIAGEQGAHLERVWTEVGRT
jgi:hypothetical protein